MRVSQPIRILALCAAAAAPAAAQGQPPAAAGRAPAAPPDPASLRVAVMPAQYFSADAESAQRLTESLRQEFASKGWQLVPPAEVQNAWNSLGLQNGQHYPDRKAIELGRQVNANLVVYPRLLALGIPVANAAPGETNLPPAAVVHLRVLNVPRARPIYFNQIAQQFPSDQPVTVAAFRLPAAAAQLASTNALVGFFQRVAGSREVLGAAPPAAPAPARNRRPGSRGRAAH